MIRGLSPERARAPLRPLAAEAAVAAFFVALALVALRPLLADPSTVTLAGGDPLVDLWTVHWLWQHFGQPAMFHGNTFVPAPHAVLYSDLSLGTVVLLLPLRPFAPDPVVLYNAALVAALAFAGWAWHRLALDLGADRSGAVAGGVLAAFASHQLFHVYHLNLLSTGWLALLLLGLRRLREGPRAGPVLLAGVSFALAAQTSGYYAVIGALLAVLFAIVEWRALRVPRVLAGYAAAAALAAVLLAPYLMASLELRAGQSFRRPVGMSASMSFLPWRDLGSEGWLYGTLLGHGGERLFPGLLALVLGGVALRRRAAGVRFLGVAALLLLALSLGPWVTIGGRELPLPYAALHALPLFESMRHPYTFAAAATFLLAMMAAVGWTALPWRGRRWAGPALIALAVAETLAGAPDVQRIPPGLPDHYALLDPLPPGPVLELPLFSDEVLVSAARHGRPMLNGQGSAFVPLDTLRLNRYLQNHWIQRTPTDVDTSRPTQFLARRFPVRYVVMPARRMRQLEPLAEAFGRSRVFAFVGESPSGSYVYEVRRENLPPEDTPASDEP